MTDAYRHFQRDLSGRIGPDRDTFRALAADRRVIPVVGHLLADDATPVGLYRRLAAGRPGTFLLESAENGRTWSRYSFIGVRSAAMLTERDGRTVWTGNRPAGLADLDSPVDALADALQVLRTPDPAGLPPLTGGLVGYIGYDAVRRWERLPDSNPEAMPIPELGLLLGTDLAVVDHLNGSVWLIANAVNFDNADTGVDLAYDGAVARVERMLADLTAPISPVATGVVDVPPPPLVAHQGFRRSVEAAKEYIRAGDAFQIVVSQRFQQPTSADPLDVYRALRMTNPSPYMYLVNVPDAADMTHPGFTIVGSSPEALVTLKGREAVLHPIAGTRPRGHTPEEDHALSTELLADPKERAEHLMLVDLGRNDLGRVCLPGTVSVVEFMQVEQYSHVLHIVSTVTGELAPEHGAADLLAATFPAGTLSGAPKPRAMEIIDELETTRRGLYAGCVGYFDFAGNMDAAIAIRTALIKDGIAVVQAGAGLVADSRPEAEDIECQNKAAAVLRALAIAEGMGRPG